jgi:hypothetical protein
MAWRAAVICTERENDTECYCVCYDDVRKDNAKSLWIVSVNYGPEPEFM